ncbi:MAG TPA: TetR/AcrR family transcriptional regulator [Solirubrobacteraceae bacterium]|nr:TetR/AcrR family transcriptional regulator [Solirubrobacteraceae bacterium]
MHSENVKDKDLPWRGDPLPRGRHKLPPGSVRASQRERLLRAMVECVAHYGFEPTTVPMVVASARTSSNAFYDFFADKTDCFLAACDEIAGELLGQLVAFASEPDWTKAMREGAGQYLRWWQERPAFARAYLLSLQSAGERSLEQRERTYAMYRAMFADLARRARAEQPDLPPLSPLVPRVLVLAITDLVAEEVRAGHIEQLHQLQDDISQLAIRLLADDVTVARAFDDRPGAQAGV